jgi:hypothetical protein
LVFLTVPSSGGGTARDTKASFCRGCIVAGVIALKNDATSPERPEFGVCSLCGKSTGEVKQMLAGKKGSLCGECALSLNAIVGGFHAE